MGAFSQAATDACRAEIAKAKAILSERRAGALAPSRKPLMLTCWRESPQLLREMIAAVAGMSPEVTRKVDRDLTEEEKAKLRAAIGKMRNRLNSLVAL